MKKNSINSIPFNKNNFIKLEEEKNMLKITLKYISEENEKLKNELEDMKITAKKNKEMLKEYINTITDKDKLFTKMNSQIESLTTRLKILEAFNKKQRINNENKYIGMNTNPIINNNNNNNINNNNIDSDSNKNNDDEIDLKDIKLKNNNNSKNVNKKISNKKLNRQLISLPTNSNKFLLYYKKCLNILNYIHSLDNKIPFLFRIPYIFGKVNNNNNNENIKNSNTSISIKIKYSLIIEGYSITNCISTPDAQKIFWQLIKNSHSLICCRCSPLQKSKIVEFIKKNTQDQTLAIGDGENDVNMIKTANIGIGIFGKEGYQAAYNSDYAISQFKYLKKLLFISGRFTIKRNSYFLYQYFYRNVLYSFPLIIFIFYSEFGATYFYDDFYNMAKNSYIAILPILFFALFEEDINFDKKDEKNLKYLLPDIYSETRDSLPFNQIKFFVIFIMGIFSSFPIFYLNFFCLCDYQIYGKNGREFSILEPGLSIYLNSLIFHFYNIFLDTHYYNWPVYSSYFLQIILDIIFVIFYESLNSGNMLCGNVYEIFSSLYFFLVFILTTVVLCLPYYILNRFKHFFGGNILNLYKITANNKKNKFNGKNDEKIDFCLKIYLKKYYVKKLEQMSIATKSINKFKMIYEDIKNKNFENENENENNNENENDENNNNNRKISDIEEYNLNEIKLRNNVKKFIKFRKKKQL